MTSFLFFSYLAVCVACLILWIDASKRKEYGRRPRVYLISILILAAAGVLLLAARYALGDNLGLYTLPLASLALLVSFTAFFVLEYSVHMQRIARSFLQEVFGRRLRIMMLIMGIAVVFLIMGAVVFHLILKARFRDLFSGSLTVEGSALGYYKRVGGWMFFLFSVSLGISAFYMGQIFKFHEGVIRQRKYPTTLFIVFIAVMLFPAILKIGFLKSYPYSAFVFLNVLFAVRAYQEYFIYRMFHLNDLHAKLEQAEKTRTQIINSVIASSAEQDYLIIKDTLASALEKTRQSLTVSAHMFNAIMTYRKKGDVLQVDSPDMIINYCAPLIRLEAVKRLGQRELNALILQHVYSLSQIGSAPRESLPGFGELAVKDMIDTKDRVIVPIPPHFKGIFRLIVLYPVYNRDELTGFVVLFKTEHDQIFPQEDAIVRSLTGNLSIIFAIMTGKEIQLEKNRLSGEMDIARSIQTSIVPRSLSIPGYQAACGMTTASEVGGDLYEYFPATFGNYFDISDVAGHGLPAGMMALIHLSALHGALFTSQTLKKELGISELYDVVNKVLCSINKKRIGSDKFMTCSVLVEKNGVFTHAGTHLIALLYKKNGDRVEELRDMIDKTAFLGLSEYVVSKDSEGSFAMESGDVLMLYTDGAIEAKNQHDEQFGLERLKAVFKEAAGQPPEAVIKATMDSLTTFAESGDMKKHAGRLADDVSLVVLRRA